MSRSEMLVRFWGVRGSYPVPGQNTIKYGGNTACIEVRAKNHIIILDAGTGIINLGNRLMEEIKANADARNREPFVINLFISHTHHDHVQGLPFFAPANHFGSILNVFGPRSFSQELKQILSLTMEPQYSPLEMEELSSQINIRNINEYQSVVLNHDVNVPHLHSQSEDQEERGNDISVKLMRSYAHPKVGVFAFRIEFKDKVIVYATDTEGYVGGDSRLTEFSRNADLLIHDAQYDPDEYMNPRSPKQGFGHSTYHMAAEVAKAAKAKHLVLFHHDPSHDDDKIAEMEAKTQKIFPNSTAGAEGLEFTL
ncbi:MBL fold metallo-hydrolase [bacterium]|nr:MBL fold metallo-hydrolase [bacterium]